MSTVIRPAHATSARAQASGCWCHDQLGQQLPSVPCRRISRSKFALVSEPTAGTRSESGAGAR